MSKLEITMKRYKNYIIILNNPWIKKKKEKKKVLKIKKKREKGNQKNMCGIQISNVFKRKLLTVNFRKKPKKLSIN